MKKKEKRTIILKNVNMSLVSAAEREKILLLLEQHGVGLVEITPAQRLVVHGIDVETSVELELKIGNLLGKRKLSGSDRNFTVTYVRACPGIESCKYAMGDAKELGRAIDALRFPKPFPHKVKISIAGCSLCCTEPYIRDVGIIATHRGWTLIFGGNGGVKPRIGDVLATNLQKENVVQLVKKILETYADKAAKKQRTARFVEQYGIDKLKEIILK